MVRAFLLGLCAALSLVVCATSVSAQEPSGAGPDIGPVVDAIMHELAHGDEADRTAAFDPAGTHNLRGPFSYAGFSPTNVVVLEHAETGGVEDVSGIMRLQDAQRRAAEIFFTASYQQTDPGLLLLSSQAGAFSPLMVHVEIFFVPQALVDRAGQDIYADWSTLHAFAEANAIGDDHARAEVCYGFIFCMDRVAPDAEFDIYLSDDRTVRRDRDSYANPVYLDYAGWRVAVIAGELKLGSLQSLFYMNVYYTPGSDVPEGRRERRRVAQYRSTDAPGPVEPSN